MIHIRNLSKETEFIFALSSGVDSVAACHLLWRRGYKFSIAHFHHNAQAINDNMVESARALARELKIPIYIGYNKDKIGDKNIEDACRQKRLEFFRKFNKNIILAQHLDDACESFFVNAMLGRTDYCPIPLKTKLDNSESILVRPFLLNDKKRFSEYAERNNLMRFVVEDLSNKNTKFRRNYIRHEILPRIPESFGLKKTVKKKLEEFYKKSI